MKEHLDLCPLDIERAKMGRGTGQGENYVPWIRIGEFKGLGEEKYLPGRKIHRLHTTLSQIERAFLEWAESCPEVIDIQEQCPLNIADTWKISQEIVIVHPRDFETRKEKVISTDFLLTTKSGLTAIALKNSKELRQTRTLQKLEIEQEYWRRKGVPWRLYTELEAGPENKRNTKWLAEAILFHGAACPQETKDTVRFLAEELWKTPKTIFEVAKEVEAGRGIQQSLDILKELIRDRV